MPARAATYRGAGVDIAGADRWLHGLKPAIRSTHGPGVMADRGQFAALFRLSAAARGLRDPVLVSSTDGAGTKLKLAQLLGRHRGIGIDAVAMNTNDIVVYGARPLFFLDYLAVGKLAPRVMSQLIEGVADGCRQSGCALIGGETAEMPGVHGPGEYDLAGFCVGVAERAKLIDGSQVRAGDAIIGLASSGVHANGFSLVRRVFSAAELRRHGNELLTPTRIYVKPVLALLAQFRIGAIAHVTGGGLRRRAPSLAARHPRLRAVLESGTWRIPAIFQRIQRAGRISDEEMHGTFNMGLGMVLTCRAQDAEGVVRLLARHRVPAWPVGSIERHE